MARSISFGRHLTTVVQQRFPAVIVHEGSGKQPTMSSAVIAHEGSGKTTDNEIRRHRARRFRQTTNDEIVAPGFSRGSSRTFPSAQARFSGRQSDSGDRPAAIRPSSCAKGSGKQPMMRSHPAVASAASAFAGSLLNLPDSVRGCIESAPDPFGNVLIARLRRFLDSPEQVRIAPNRHDVRLCLTLRQLRATDLLCFRLS